MKNNQIDKLVDENDYNHTKENNNLPRKQNKNHKFRLRFAAILAAIGLTGLATAISGEKDKTLPEGKIIEQEIENQDNVITNSNKEDFRNTISVIPTISEAKKQVDSLETKEDVLAFLKNEYIEKYEQMTGDTNLTTDDIKIIISNQDYVFSNEEEIVTHGSNPGELQNQLEQYGTYRVINNCEVYEIINQDGKIIDAATYKDNTLVPVIPGDNYTQMQHYNSSLTQLGDVIPNGLAFYEYIENGNDDASYSITKRKLINALEGNTEAQTNNNEIENDDIERS